MGLIRGGLALIVGILLFASLLVGNVFLTFNLSINPENIQEEVVNNLDNIIDSVENETQINLTEEIEEKTPLIESYCENNTEFVYSQDGYTVDIPCEVALEGKEAIVEESIGDIVDEIYTEEYECNSFWDCALNPKENPFYLFSEEAKQSWKNIFYYSLILSLILIGLMFLLIERKSSFFITLGILFIITSLPFIKIESFFSLFENEFIQFISVLFSEANLVFLIGLSLGIIILVIGIGLKLILILTFCLMMNFAGF